MKDIEKKGIYKIFNVEDGRYYVGSATISFSKRLSQHISDLGKNKHRNIHLQRAYNKHGWENFIFVIIEILDLPDSEIIKREQWYLDQKADYNIATVAENSAKGRKMTEEQRVAHSERLKGKKAWNKGIPFSLESRQKMSKSMKGRTGPNKGKTGISNNPLVRSDGQVYKNPQEAAEVLGVKSNTIIKAITDKNKIRKVRGFTFKYMEKKK